MQPELSDLDHLVLTVTDIEVSLAFYVEVLGMRAEAFCPADGSRRWALRFGRQKINLHLAGAEFEPKAARAMPGTADLCFLSDVPLEDWLAHLAARPFGGRGRAGAAQRGDGADPLDLPARPRWQRDRDFQPGGLKTPLARGEGRLRISGPRRRRVDPGWWCPPGRR
ncbi:Catechol 2,3-dioxygenase [Roseovarius tolerans]|uniref:Catechol 2,3-dioxygenase n=1 Tax=Roseovarius tolerans TaxID=74031 RepID=A0A1H7X388_9RHOB|nr:Catechol 2,3-dioxygenase [Roseovarius tolerans]